MKIARCFLAWVIFSGVVVQGCGSVQPVRTDLVTGVSAGSTPAPVQNLLIVPGPRVEVSYSPLADVLHMVEQASLWRRGMPATYLRVVEDLVGLDPAERDALRKYALLRTELQDRVAKNKPLPSFSDPFGPQGLFPSSSPSVVDRFWGNILEAGQPDRVVSALQGLMKPADAGGIAEVLTLLAPRLDDIRASKESVVEQVNQLYQLLRREEIGLMLERMGRFFGVPTEQLSFVVHPVWVPEGADLEAVAYGDRILVTVSEKEPAGVQQVALVIHEIGRRLLSRAKAEKKANYTRRFVEKTGFDRRHFYLAEGILDAFSYGLCVPLITQDARVSLPWPGDASQRKYSEALVHQLRRYLDEQKTLDMKFVNQAATLFYEMLTPKPSDFLDGAMVIGQDKAIEVFKSQVVRWTVWRFPLSKKYNFSRKLADNPGRTVLLLLTPNDLRTLRLKFEGIERLPGVLRNVSGYIQKKRSVLIAVARPSRGYVFVLAAISAQGMKELAKVFFALKKVPVEALVLE